MLPKQGAVCLSLTDADKILIKKLGESFSKVGFSIVATGGTHKALIDNGIEAEFVHKISEGRPNIEDKLRNKDIALGINTSDNKSSKDDAKKIRQSVLRLNVPYFTTISEALVASEAIANLQKDNVFEPKALQEYLKV